MSNGGQNRGTKKPVAFAWVAFIVLAFAGVGGWLAYKYFFEIPPKTADNDPVCTYVSDKLQLKCVVGLAAEGVLGPGHFVSYPANPAPHTKVPFPDGDLFSKSCLVPGEQAANLLAALKQQEQENSVVVDEITFKFDRSFRAGAELPIPRLSNLVLKAGPKMTEVEEIGMKAPHAWIKIIDTNMFLDVLDNAGIRKQCVDNLLSADYHVVSKALIAKDVQITVTDKAGKSVDLSAAASSGQLSVSGGAAANSNIDQTIKSETSTPVVLGVEFLSSGLFKQRPKLAEPVVYSTSGQATVSVVGNGGEGLLPQKVQSAFLGNAVSVNLEGGESSECEGGAERTKSLAQLNSLLRPINNQSIEFSSSGQIGGGHYATGRCVFGKLIVGAGHDNGVSAVSSFNAYIRATVRSDDKETLALEFHNLPANSRVEVRDPRGEPLSLRNADQPASAVEGNGNLEFVLRGAGVYLAQISATYSHSVNGAGRLPVNDTGSVSVNVR
jgi:hypothetical protein